MDGNYAGARILKEFAIDYPFRYLRRPPCPLRKRHPVLISANVLEATKLMWFEFHTPPENVSRELVEQGCSVPEATVVKHHQPNEIVVFVVQVRVIDQ